jgi:hypothetical protein
MLKQQTLEVMQGANRLELDLGVFGEGMYFIRVYGDDTPVATGRAVVR